MIGAAFMNSSLLQNTRSNARKAFDSLVLPELTYGLDIRAPISESVLVFSDVEEKPASLFHETNEHIVICDLETALEKFPNEMKKIGSLLSLKNKFESYHLAHLRHGLVVIVPENVQSQNPVVLPGISAPHSHVLIVVGKNSTVFIDHIEGSHSSAHPVHSSGVEIFAEENAHVSYSSLQDYSQGHHFSFKRAHVGKGASVDWHWAD